MFMALQNPGENISYIRPVSAPGTDLIIANNSSRKWQVFHETYTLCSVAQGSSCNTYRGKKLFLEGRSSILMEPGETHHAEPITPGNFKVLLIPPAIFTDAAREQGLSTTPHLRLPDSNDPKLFLTLYRFCAAVETGESLLEQQSLFTACLRTLLEQTEQRLPALGGMNAHRAVARIKRHLQEKFAEAISLDELVALTGLSKFHLVRTFTKQVGMAPHIYQINIRIARACKLLKAGVPPVCVSSDLGFADQSHFTRHFKRCCGVTPSSYAYAAKL